MQIQPEPTVDVICGDLNMARWRKDLTDKEAANWNEGTLGELEKRGYIPVADYSDECCFVAVHDSIAQSLHIKGSSWAERTKTLNLDQRTAFGDAFLEQVGAKLRQRTPAAIERRNEKKRLRGYFVGRSSGSPASSSGSAAPAAPAALADRAHWDSDSNWYGRSNGSGDWSGGRSESRWYGYGRSSGSGAWRCSGSGEWWGWHSDSNWYGRSSGSGAW